MSENLEKKEIENLSQENANSNDKSLIELER